MDSQKLQQPQHHQAVLNYFVTAGLADERVVAAFLGGSYARGTADAYSDLDLYLITTDEAERDLDTRASQGHTLRRDALRHP